MADSTPSGAIPASREAIESACRALSPLDQKRLFCAAQYLLQRAARACLGHTAEDLYQEALYRTYAGKRRWDPGRVDFVHHLVGAMRSIVHEWLRKALRLPLRFEFVEADGSPGGHEVGEVPSHEEVLAQQEARDQVVARIRTCFPGDEHIEYILMGLEDELGRADIMRESNMTELQYDAARKRITRALQPPNSRRSRP